MTRDSSREQQVKITRRLVAEVVATIRDRFHPEKVVIFGSFARGGMRSHSDLDVLVVLGPRNPAYLRPGRIRLALPRSVPIDVLVFTPSEVRRWNGAVGHIVTEALRTGRVMYEKAA